MKKRIKYIIMLVMLFLICGKVEALSVARNPLTISEGSNDTVELYANVGDNTVNEIKFTLVYYEVAKASFIPASGVNCNTVDSTHTITFSDGMSGRILLGLVKIDVYNNVNVTTASVAYAHAAFAKTLDGNVVNLNNVMINVNINKVTPVITEPATTEPTTMINTVEPTTVVQNESTTKKITTSPTTTRSTTTTTTTKIGENKRLLKEINSKITKITLEDNVYEYTVNVNETIQELDLAPVVNDEKTKVEISSQKISELEDKQITINLTNQNIKEKYVIKVNVVPKPTVKPVVIDNKKFVEKNSYKGKWIVAIVLLGIVLILSVLFLNNKKK